MNRFAIAKIVAIDRRFIAVAVVMPDLFDPGKETILVATASRGSHPERGGEVNEI